MNDLLPLSSPCPRCGGMSVKSPAEFGENNWLACAQCAEPVITWSAYKADAMLQAARTIRGRTDVAGRYRR